MLDAHDLFSYYVALWWNPREEPTIIAGNVFDAYSISRWITNRVRQRWEPISKEMGIAEVFWNVVEKFAWLHKAVSVIF
jgi:hypothetical protein